MENTKKEKFAFKGILNDKVYTNREAFEADLEALQKENEPLYVYKREDYSYLEEDEEKERQRILEQEAIEKKIQEVFKTDNKNWYKQSEGKELIDKIKEKQETYKSCGKEFCGGSEYRRSDNDCNKKEIKETIARAFEIEKELIANDVIRRLSDKMEDWVRNVFFKEWKEQLLEEVKYTVKSMMPATCEKENPDNSNEEYNKLLGTVADVLAGLLKKEKEQ